MSKAHGPDDEAAALMHIAQDACVCAARAGVVVDAGRGNAIQGVCANCRCTVGDSDCEEKRLMKVWGVGWRDAPIGACDGAHVWFATSDK